MKTDNVVNLENDKIISPLKTLIGSEKLQKVVLVGNPNVGKSCFFNFMSGMYVDVSNFPGTTVSITKSHFQGNDVFDTPGIYGVGSFNDEEK